MNNNGNVDQLKKSIMSKLKEWFSGGEELKGMSIHVDRFGEIRPAMSTAEIGIVGREICRMVRGF